jgi:hypothetical protein
MGRKPEFRSDTGAGATVAQDPEPGRRVRHTYRSPMWDRGAELSHVAGTTPVPPARTGRKGRKPASALLQVEATYRLGA